MPLHKPIPSVKGFTYNASLFASKKALWVRAKNTGNYYKCPTHGTMFDPHEEPCWRCWDSCQEEIT